MSTEEDDDVGLSYRARNIDEAGGFFTNDENGGREYDMDDDNRGDGYGRAANNSADFEDGGLKLVRPLVDLFKLITAAVGGARQWSGLECIAHEPLR